LLPNARSTLYFRAGSTRKRISGRHHGGPGTATDETNATRPGLHEPVRGSGPLFPAHSRSSALGKKMQCGIRGISPAAAVTEQKARMRLVASAISTFGHALRRPGLALCARLLGLAAAAVGHGALAAPPLGTVITTRQRSRTASPAPGDVNNYPSNTVTGGVTQVARSPLPVRRHASRRPTPQLVFSHTITKYRAMVPTASTLADQPAPAAPAALIRSVPPGSRPTSRAGRPPPDSAPQAAFSPRPLLASGQSYSFVVVVQVPPPPPPGNSRRCR